MVEIPLDTIPNQQFNIVLGGQNCTIHLYQRGDYLYMDLSVDGNVVRNGMLCLVNTLLTNYRLLRFSGYLFFIDTYNQGGIPNYKELDTRYILVYEEG